MSKETGIPADKLCSTLDKLSICFGALAGNKAEYFFLDNPVWTKPLIKIGDGRFFCAIPQVFFSFIFPIFDKLLSDSPQAKSAYQKRRADFLEKEIRAIFSKSFPHCEIFAGYKWKDGDNEYENDLLVKVDSHLILVEAKSGAISWQALRGAPDRMKRHVDELLYAPSNQSYRLSNRIYESKANAQKQFNLLPNFPFNLDEIKTVLRLSVTLEDFAFIQTNLHLIKETGWIPEDHQLAPCMHLADLEVIFDMLESTPQKIHYLKRRSELEANMNYMGDELDLLGFYLKTGFNIGVSEFNKDHFMLTGMSKKVDEYYTALDNGIQRKRPQQKMTNWWRDICMKLEVRGFHQWSDIANILLGFSFSEQLKAEASFKRIKKHVLKFWQQDGHLCSIIITPSKYKFDAMALYAFRDRDKERRKERMENIAAQTFANSHVKRCLILGVNIDKDQYPYSIIAVYFND